TSRTHDVSGTARGREPLRNLVQMVCVPAGVTSNPNAATPQPAYPRTAPGPGIRTYLVNILLPHAGHPVTAERSEAKMIFAEDHHDWSDELWGGGGVPGSLRVDAPLPWSLPPEWRVSATRPSGEGLGSRARRARFRPAGASAPCVAGRPPRSAAATGRCRWAYAGCLGGSIGMPASVSTSTMALFMRKRWPMVTST